MGAPTLATRVVVDGTTAYGSVADLEAGRSTVLDTISITWGRSTTVDNPETGSCSLTMRQQQLPQPGQRLLEAIHTGSAVEVWVDATIPPPGPPSNETMAFTNFSQDPIGALTPSRWLALGVTAAPGVAGTTTPGVAVDIDGGVRGAFADVPDSPSWSADFYFPPRPWATTNEIDAWGLLPRLLPGGTWLISATVRVPANTGPVFLRVDGSTTARSSGPFTPLLINGTTNGITLTADGAWHTVTGTVQLSPGWSDPGGAYVIPHLVCSGMPDRTTWSQSTGNWLAHPETWRSRRAVGLNTISILQTSPTARSVLVWAGTVTAAHLKPAGDQAVVLDVTCSDPGAKLANNTIGDTPWPHNETLIARATRIQELAHDPLTLVVDSGLQNVRLAYKDVDAQPVLGLLQDLATSGGGVLWVAAHAGAGSYLWMEDTAQRESAFIFVIDSATGIVTIDDNERATALLSAYDLLLDPLDVGQDSTNVITSVDVGWQLMIGTDTESGQPILEEQTHTETETDPDRLDTFGLITQSISTDLISEVDATNRATRSLQQGRASDWQLDGLSYDSRALVRPIPPITDLDRTHIVLNLLDGLLRLGMGITLLDMPAWMPADIGATMYVEGGTYAYSSGHWELDLTVSPSGSQGHSAAWREMPPEVSWSDMDWSISWVDAYGVAAPVPTALEEN